MAFGGRKERTSLQNQEKFAHDILGAFLVFPSPYYKSIVGTLFQNSKNKYLLPSESLPAAT